MRQTTNASTFYKKGSVIHSEKPFVYILSSKLTSERCDFCFQRAELLICTGCRITHYCDRGCQKNGWYFHKKECAGLKRVAPNVVPDTARLIARTIHKLEKGGAREQSFYSPRQFRVFMDLMSHYQEIKVDQRRMEHFETLKAVLEVFLGATAIPNPVELLRIYGKLVVNTFSILDGEMQSIGTGMYLGASIVDHSCNPNAVVVFAGTTLQMRALVDIPSLDWTKIFISYIDAMKMPSERQKDLLETYYFLCQCSRCLDVEELNLMTASLCQNQKCRRRVPGGTKDLGVQCQACGAEVSAQTWEELSEISEFTNQQLSSMKDVAYLDVCRMCLKKQEGLFDPMNILRVRVLDMAMESSIEVGSWEAALSYGRQLIEPYLKYYGETNPLTGIFFMKMGKMALLLNKKEDAREWLKQAAVILRITHGNDHPLIREELLDYMRQCCD